MSGQDPRLAALEAVAVSLLALQVEQAGDWRALWIALGRATEATARDDDTEALRWLQEAADLEYMITGSADTVGAVLDADDCPETARTGEVAP